MLRTVEYAWNMHCPNCKRDDELIVTCITYAKLVPNGMEHYADYDWDSKSPIQCSACEWSGLAGECEIEDVEDSAID